MVLIPDSFPGFLKGPAVSSRFGNLTSSEALPSSLSTRDAIPRLWCPVCARPVRPRETDEHMKSSHPEVKDSAKRAFRRFPLYIIVAILISYLGGFLALLVLRGSILGTVIIFLILLILGLSVFSIYWSMSRPHGEFVRTLPATCPICDLETTNGSSVPHAKFAHPEDHRFARWVSVLTWGLFCRQ